MSQEYHQSTERPAKLEEEIRTTIEEARMVLPGIQALFGFQLIAVFNARFHDFSELEQMLHLVALLLVAVAIALIMTPAAYHRIAERGTVSRRFIDLASRLLESALMPLMLGISLDLFLKRWGYQGVIYPIADVPTPGLNPRPLAKRRVAHPPPSAEKENLGRDEKNDRRILPLGFFCHSQSVQ